MIALLWACATVSGPPGGVPEGLVAELSVIHEVTPHETLVARYPGLTDHLLTLAQDPATSPLVRDRAWVRLAESPDARAQAAAVDGALDPAVPSTTRAKVARRLVDDPRWGPTLTDALQCDAHALVQRAVGGPPANGCPSGS